MTKIAIVILNWNGSKMLKTFLPSVIRHSLTEETTIYIADNGSTDDSIAMLREIFPNVRLIILNKNYGFAEGYNLALKQVEAEYVVLLNSDVEVTEGWLQPLKDYMDNHPDTAACQPKILSYRNKNQFEYAGAAGGFIDKYGYPFCRGRILNTVEQDNGQYNTIVPVFWATGAALFIRLKDYLEVGGLDGKFFAHMEEIDLCWRLRSRGKSIVCIPQSTIYHVGGATLKKENPFKTFLNFRNNLIMLYKNLPDSEFKKVMFIRSILDYVAALSFLLKGNYSNARAVIKARREYKSMRKHYDAIRQKNLHQTSSDNIAERLNRSILTEYYLKHHNTYDKVNEIENH